MTQITSSAIWNGPSPDNYVSMLNRTNTAGRLSQRTHEKLLRIFAARRPHTTLHLPFKNPGCPKRNTGPRC